MGKTPEPSPAAGRGTPSTPTHGTPEQYDRTATPEYAPGMSPVGQLAQEEPHVVVRARTHARVKLRSAFGSAALDTQRIALEEPLDGGPASSRRSVARRLAFERGYQEALHSPQAVTSTLSTFCYTAGDAACAAGAASMTRATQRARPSQHAFEDVRAAAAMQHLPRAALSVGRPPVITTMTTSLEEGVAIHPRQPSAGAQLLARLWHITASCVPPHSELRSQLEALAAAGGRPMFKHGYVRGPHSAGSRGHGSTAAASHSVAHWASLLSCTTQPAAPAAAAPHPTPPVFSESATLLSVTPAHARAARPWPGAPAPAPAASSPTRKLEAVYGGGPLLSTWWLVQAAHAVGDATSRRWLSTRLGMHGSSGSSGAAGAGEASVAGSGSACEDGDKVEGDAELRSVAARAVARALLAAASGA